MRVKLDNLKSSHTPSEEGLCFNPIMVFYVLYPLMFVLQRKVRNPNSRAMLWLGTLEVLFLIPN